MRLWNRQDHFRTALRQPLFRKTLSFYYTMHNDRLEVDELILEIADYKNDYADMAAEKLLR
ncbi:MAG: hypothetical protein WAN56_09145 [Halobacteriota archaeon]